jgi:dUTPase
MIANKKTKNITGKTIRETAANSIPAAQSVHKSSVPTKSEIVLLIACVIDPKYKSKIMMATITME